MADRETSSQALMTVLQAVDTIKFVTREDIELDDVAESQFPCIIIRDDGDEEIFYKTGGFADVEFKLKIIGWVNNPVTTTLVNELDKNTKKALGTDFLDSTGIMQTAGLHGFTIDPLIDREARSSVPVGGFVREVTLRYESSLTEGL